MRKWIALVTLLFVASVADAGCGRLGLFQRRAPRAGGILHRVVHREVTRGVAGCAGGTCAVPAAVPTKKK